jgi:hypothetical protein
LGSSRTLAGDDFQRFGDQDARALVEAVRRVGVE